MRVKAPVYGSLLALSGKLKDAHHKSADASLYFVNKSSLLLYVFTVRFYCTTCIRLVTT